MPDREITVRSLEEYIQCIAELNPLPSEIGLMQQEITYRGHSNCSHSLMPSLGRQPDEQWLNTYETKETELIQSAQQKFPHLFGDSQYPIFKLAKLQHYGIPTRLLDVTANALVALYFACQKRKGTTNDNADGEVIAFSAYVRSAFDPYVNAIADTARLCNGMITNSSTFYYRVCRQSYFAGQVYPPDSNGMILQEDFFKQIKQPLLVDVGDICTRQQHQQGKFLIFPARMASDDSNMYGIGIKELEKEDDMVIKRIIIPKELKEKIRTILPRLGISKEYLFADDIDTVCKEIVEKQATLYRRPLGE